MTRMNFGWIRSSMYDFHTALRDAKSFYRRILSFQYFRFSWKFIRQQQLVMWSMRIHLPRQNFRYKYPSPKSLSFNLKTTYASTAYSQITFPFNIFSHFHHLLRLVSFHYNFGLSHHICAKKNTNVPHCCRRVDFLNTNIDFLFFLHGSNNEILHTAFA